MINALIVFVVYVLVVSVFASIVPLITLIVFKLKRNKKTEFIYIFPYELFEAEYSNTNCLKHLNEQYEERKSEEFVKQLP